MDHLGTTLYSGGSKPDQTVKPDETVKPDQTVEPVLCVRVSRRITQSIFGILGAEAALSVKRELGAAARP